MKKTFTYEFVKEEYENGDNSYDTFDYCPSEIELKANVVDVMFDTFFSRGIRLSFDCEQIYAIKQAFKQIIEDNLDEFVDRFEDELKECFEEDAREEYKYNRG